MAKKKSDQVVDGNVWTITKMKERTGDETPNFELTLCLNGKPVAYVQNHGCGGCNEWSWIDSSARPAWQALVKQRLPNEDFEPEDTLIEDMRMVHKRFQRAIKSRVLYTVKGKPGIYTANMRKRPLSAVLPLFQKPEAREKLAIDQILNELPADKAWSLYFNRMEITD